MTSTSKKPIYLTANELAERWRVTTLTVQKWRGEGKPPNFYKINGTILYKLAEIEDLEKANRKTITSN
tara:strand:+ start:2295 stop:2498 length:204 start_codon:yes stop_codon:yes gene_type:complete